MGPVIDPKMCNLQEIIGFLVKNSVIFKSVCFKTDRVITQHTPNYVENCSEHYNDHIIVHLIITSFSVTLIITLKTVCFICQIPDQLSC